MFSALSRSLKNERSLASIQSNLLAGLTVGIIALPLSMALAIASGVAPQQGLYTAIVGSIVIALTGGSKVNISGPTAAFVVILLPIVQQYGLGGLLVSGFMAGGILILMGLFRLGRFIEIVPYPVTIGFTAGIGVVIATIQIKDFLGLNFESPANAHYVDKLVLLYRALPTVNWQESAIGCLTLLVLVLWSRRKSKIPGHLVALLIGSIAAWLGSHNLDGFSVATINSRFHYEQAGLVHQGIPPFLPHFSLPWEQLNAQGKPIGISFELVRNLLSGAITIAVLGALESLLCAVIADGMSGKKHSPNDELIGQGLGNMIAPFFGGIPATAAIARTAASIRAGGSSPLASVVHGLFIIVAILLLTPMLGYIPMASMSALLLMVAWNMSETKHFIRTLKIAPRDDVIALLTCFLLTIIFDMTIAVAVGMSLSAVLFINRSISLTQVSAIDLEKETQLNFPKETIIYEINGPLFFGSAQKALRSITDISLEIKIVVLDMTKVSMLDMSAIIAMESIIKNCTDNQLTLIISNLQPRMILKLRRAGLHGKHQNIYFARSLTESLEISKKIANNILE